MCIGAMSLITFGGCSTRPIAVTAPAVAEASEERLPPDVAAFVESRDACDHFRGEPAYDDERATFLAKAIARDCAGTDRRLADLRRRYAKDASILARLAEYEEQIE